MVQRPPLVAALVALPMVMVWVQGLQATRGGSWEGPAMLMVLLWWFSNLERWESENWLNVVGYKFFVIKIWGVTMLLEGLKLTFYTSYLLNLFSLKKRHPPRLFSFCLSPTSQFTLTHNHKIISLFSLFCSRPLTLNFKLLFSDRILRWWGRWKVGVGVWEWRSRWFWQCSPRNLRELYYRRDPFLLRTPLPISVPQTLMLDLNPLVPFLLPR